MKRFCDTELSDKEWFMDLSCRLKCAVRYLFDKCDSAGVWVPNYKLASTYVGEPFTEDEILSVDSGDQFQKFGEKILVKGFIEFQYGELSEKCNPHRNIIKKLVKHGLWVDGKLRVPEISGRVPEKIRKGLGTLEEVEEDKEEEEDKDKEKDFEKSEKLLVPEMEKIWVKHKPDYPKDKIKDYTALQGKAFFICEQSGINYAKRTEPDDQNLYDLWGTISEFVSTHKFFKNYSLMQIENHIQSITQEIKNGKSDNQSKSAVGKVNGQQVDAAFAKFYSQGQPISAN